jgi:hypothetical protein
MRRQFDFDFHTLKGSSSHDRLSTRRPAANPRLHLEKFSPIFWKSPPGRLSSLNDEPSYSVDTRSFRSPESNSARLKDNACQTDAASPALEALHLENQSLTADVRYLKLELDALRTIVSELSLSSNHVRIKANEDLIRHLQKENSTLMKTMQEKRLSLPDLRGKGSADY